MNKKRKNVLWGIVGAVACLCLGMWLGIFLYSRSPRFRGINTGKNKIKRGSAFRSHILTKMSQKRKRNLREAQYVDSTNVSAVKKMLCK